MSQGLHNTTTKVVQPGTYYGSVGFDLGSMQGSRGTVTLVTPTISGRRRVSASMATKNTAATGNQRG